jgi:hypothetical protein
MTPSEAAELSKIIDSFVRVAMLALGMRALISNRAHMAHMTKTPR